MNKKAISTFTLAALLLTACSEEEMPMDDARVALQVTSGIQTRAYDDQWEADDRIGIFGHPQDADQTAWSNVQYVTSNDGSNGSFAPAPDELTIYLPVNGSGVDFVAYYPYTATLTDGVYAVDVTEQGDLSAIDLMAAGEQTADCINPKVRFNFEHKLSKIEFTFKAGDGMAASELAGMTVQLTGQQPKATFDVTQPDGAVNVGTDNPIMLTLNTASDGMSAEGILLPNESLDNMTLHLVLADKSNFFIWNLNESTAQKFEAGHKYVYNITVNRSGLGVTSTIADWEEGNGPDGESGNAY